MSQATSRYWSVAICLLAATLAVSGGCIGPHSIPQHLRSSLAAGSCDQPAGKGRPMLIGYYPTAWNPLPQSCITGPIPAPPLGPEIVSSPDLVPGPEIVPAQENSAGLQIFPGPAMRVDEAPPIILPQPRDGRAAP